MFGLDQLLGQEQGNQALQEISNNVGAEPSQVNNAIQMALPAILGGLARNASTPEGAESLNNALDQHDGGVLDNLGGLGSLIFGAREQQPAPPPPQYDSGGILGHIFGNSQGNVAQKVSEQTGLGTGQVAQILMLLAPIVMGYLGRQKQSQGLDAGGLGGVLGGLLGGGQQQGSGNSMMDMVSGMLDSDRDGSAMDDIASMAFNRMMGRK